MHCFLLSYHCYFRVSDYGFNKLIELFEAVPGTVEVTEDPDGERLLQLTDSERLSVVAEQIATLVKSSRRQGCDIFTAYGTSDPLHERFCKFPISSTSTSSSRTTYSSWKYGQFRAAPQCEYRLRGLTFFKTYINTFEISFK